MNLIKDKLIIGCALVCLAACADDGTTPENPMDAAQFPSEVESSSSYVADSGLNGDSCVDSNCTFYESSSSVVSSSENSSDEIFPNLSSSSENANLPGGDLNEDLPIVSLSSSGANSFDGEISSGVENSSSSFEDYESPSNGNSPAITYGAAGANVEQNNGCVAVNDGEVVITCAGDYDFSGSYSGADAQIRVYSPKSDSGVYLNLKNLTLENTADAPVYVQMASKVFVVAKKETTNKLSDGATRTKSFTYENSKGEQKTDTTSAAIYSKDDLTIKGAGTLIVNGNYNNGIQCSNDLRFRGETTVNVTAKNNGIKGKGSVDIEKGNITVEAVSGDGIKSDEFTVSGTDTTIVEGKGIVVIKGGTINITKTGDDGIQAFNYVMIADSVSVPSVTVNAGGKGIASENRVYINGGKIDVNSTDDGIHSNLNVYFNGGFTTISTKDDGVHADSALRIADGTIYVKDSYEGLEAWYITVSGGVTDVYASDDGWNAAGGNDGSGNNNPWGGFEWGRAGFGGFPGGGFGPGGASSGYLTVTGGVHYIKTGSGDTDGMDSNGELTISGGVIVVECQIGGGMGGSFDSDGSASITSKTVLGFSRSRSEAGTNYNVSFSPNGYYGNSNIAFKPTTSGSYAQGTSQVSAVSDVSGYEKSQTFPSGNIVYYN